jgi:hypothetical protein
VQKGEAQIFQLSGLEEFFDEDLSKSVLGVSFDEVVCAIDVVKKSLYDFDLESTEGVTKLLELLPIMDPEILRDIAGEIWPGYPTQDADAKLLRLEIKGYLMDYLDGYGQEEAATAPEGLAEPQGTEEGTAAPEVGSESPPTEPGAVGVESPPTEGSPTA